MSRDSRTTASNDYNKFHADPSQLAKAMQTHQADPFYLAEIVQLAGGNFEQLHQQALASHAVDKHHDIFKTAADANKGVKTGDDQAQHAKKSARDGQMAIQDDAMSGDQGQVASEELVAQMAKDGTLENFGNQGWDSIRRHAIGERVGLAVHDGLIDPKVIAGYHGIAWDHPGKNSFAPPNADTATDAARDGAAVDINSAKSNLDKAEKKLAGLDQQLAMQLEGDQLEATMTPDKRAAYIKHFQSQPDYIKATGAVAAASLALQKMVERDGKDVLAFAGDKSDPKSAGTAAKQMLDTYRALAGAPGNGPMLAKLANQPPPELATHDQDLLAIAQEAYNNHTQEVLRSFNMTNPTPSAIEAALQKVKTTLVDPYDLYVQFRDLSKVGVKINNAVALLKKDKGKVEFKQIIEVFRTEEGEAHNATRLSACLAALVGGAAEADQAGGDLGKLATAVLSRGRDFLAAAKDGKKGEELATGAKAVVEDTSALSKAMPLLGLAIAGAQLKEDGAAALKYHDPAAIAASVGDLVSIVGSALEATPLAPLGEAINVVGSAITFFAHLFEGDPEGDKRRKTEKESLVAIDAYGKDTAQLAPVFTDSDAKASLIRVSKDTPPWTTEQIQRIATTSSYLFSGAYMLETADNVRQFFANKRNGGLSSTFTGSLHAFVTSMSPNDLKSLCDFAGRFSFRVVARANPDEARAVYIQLQRYLGKSDWSNQHPSFA